MENWLLLMSCCKANLMNQALCPVKTQNSLGLHIVWSVFTVCMEKNMALKQSIKLTTKLLFRLGGCPGWSGCKTQIVDLSQLFYQDEDEIKRHLHDDLVSRRDERATNVYTVLTRYTGDAQDEELIKVCCRYTITGCCLWNMTYWLRTLLAEQVMEQCKVPCADID